MEIWGLIWPPFDEEGFEKRGFSKPPLLEAPFEAPSKGGGETRRVKGGFLKGGLRRASRFSRRGAPWGFKGGFKGASKGLREGGLLKGASRRGGGLLVSREGKPPFSKPLRSPFEAPLEAPLEKPPFSKPRSPFEKPPFSKPPLWETRSSFEKPHSPLFRFSARTTTTTTTSLAPTTYTKICPACTTPFFKPTHGRHTFSQASPRNAF